MTLRGVLKKATPELELQIEKEVVIPPPPVRTPISPFGQRRREAFIGTHQHPVGPHAASLNRPFSHPGSMSMSLKSAASVGSIVMDGIPDFVDPEPEPHTQHSMPQLPHRTSPLTNKEDKASKNPMLASLLDQDTSSPDNSQPPSMLSALLGNDSQQNSNAPARQRRPRKRKSMTDVKSPGRSPKRKASEDDFAGAIGKEFSGFEVDGMGIHANSGYEQMPGSLSAALSQAESNVPHHHMNDQVNQVQYGNSNLVESHVSRLATSLDNIINKESKNLPAPHPADLQPPPMVPGSEIKMEQQPQVKMERDDFPIKRESPVHQGSLHTSVGALSCKTVSKGNSLADLLKTDSPNSENHPATGGGDGSGLKGNTGAPSHPQAPLLPPPATVPKKEPGLLGHSQHDRLVGPGNRNHKSFDSGLTNSNVKSQGFKRSNSVEILESTPGKVKIEPSDKPPLKPGNLFLTKNSVSRDKMKLVNDMKLDSVLKAEEKQGSAGSVKDKIKKKEAEEGTPRLTVKLNTRDLTAKTIVKEPTPPVTTPPIVNPLSQDPFDQARAITPKGSSAKMAFNKSNKERDIYEIGSDSEDTDTLLPLSYPRTAMLSAEPGKPGSPSVKIRKVRPPDDSNKFERKKSSKYDGDHVKKKRTKDSSEGKRDKIKKRKTYDSSVEFGGSVSGMKSPGSVSVPGNRSLENKGPTMIRISTTVEGKLKITSRPPGTSPSGMRHSPKAAGSSPGSHGSRGLSKGSTSTSKLGKSLSSKQLARSKSDPQGTGVGKISDTKLSKTPTIKLKPLVMPSSTATVTVANPGAAKHSQSATTPSAPNAPQNPGSKSASVENAVGKSGPKAPLPPPKQRKGSLSAVIDKLKQQQHPPRKDHSLSKKIEKIEKSAEAAGKKDAITEKKKLDDIRNAIIRAGSQSHPSFSGKESKSSQRKSEFEPGFNRIEKSGINRVGGSGTPPASLPSIPIPKISKTSGASPAAPPSTPIPKLSNTTKSNSGGSVSKFNASGSVLSRSASNMIGAPTTESNSNHGNRTSGPGVKDSAYSNKGSHELEKEKPGGGQGPPSRNFPGPQNPSQFVHNKPPSLLGKDFPKPPGLSARDSHASPSHNYGQHLHNNKDASGMVNSNSEESAKRMKLDDSLDRSQGRHFLDAIGLGASTSQKKSDNPGNPSVNKDHKSGLKRTGSSNNLDTNSPHHNHGNGDKGSRLNGHNRIPNNNSASSDGYRSSPKEESTKTDKFNSNKETHSTYNSGNQPGLDGAVSNANIRSSANPVVDRTKTGSKVNSSDVNNRTTKQSSHSDILTGGNNPSSSSIAQSSSLSKVSQSNSLAGSSSTSSSSCHSNSGTQGNVKLTNSHDTPPSSTTSSSAIHSNDTRHNVSPSVNKQDSLGAFDDKENTIASPDPGEDTVFKAPTPKPIRLEAESHVGESGGRAPRLEKIKPIRSPCSNPSSPEDSLVIDCPGTPTSNKSVKSPVSRSNDHSPVTVARTKSPVVVNAVSSGGTSTVPTEVKTKSPAGVVSIANAKNLPPPRSPSPRKTLTPTLTSKLPPPASPSPPPKSPMMQHNSPVGARQPPASPCDLDDDLMDEALIL